MKSNFFTHCQPPEMAAMFAVYLRDFADNIWWLEQKFWAEIGRKFGWISTKQVRESLAKQLEESQQGHLVHLGEIWLGQGRLQKNQVVQLIQESGGQVLFCSHCQFHLYKPLACSSSDSCPRCNGKVEETAGENYPLPAVLHTSVFSPRIVSNKAMQELSPGDFLFLDLGEYVRKDIHQIEEEIALIVQAFDFWLATLAKEGDLSGKARSAKIVRAGKAAGESRAWETSRAITHRISKALIALDETAERRRPRQGEDAKSSSSLVPLCSGYMHNLHELLWMLQQKVFARLCVASSLLDEQQLEQVTQLQENALANGEILHVGKAALRLEMVKEKDVAEVLQRMGHSLWVCPFCRLSLWQMMSHQTTQCPRCQGKTLNSALSPELLHKQLAAVLFPLLPILPVPTEQQTQVPLLQPAVATTGTAEGGTAETATAPNKDASQILSESGISQEISQFMKSMEHIASDEEIYDRYLSAKAGDPGGNADVPQELPNKPADAPANANQLTPFQYVQVSEKIAEEKLPLEKRMTPLHLLQVRPKMSTASSIPVMPKSRGKQDSSSETAIAGRARVSRASQAMWLLLLLFPLLSGVWIFFDQYRAERQVSKPQIQPVTQPDKPVEPDRPTVPDKPVEPIVPDKPVEPIVPDKPVEPDRPPDRPVPDKTPARSGETALQKFLQNKPEPQDIAVTLLHLNKNQLFREDLPLVKDLYAQYPNEDQLRQLLIKTAATIGGQEARVWLEDILTSSIDQEEKVKIIQALEKVGKTESRKLLLRTLQENNESDLCLAAASALSNITPQDESVYHELVNKFYGTDSERARHGFLLAISGMKIRDAGQFFIKVAMQEQYNIALRVKALDALSVYALHYKEATWIQAELSRMSNVPNLILRRKIEELSKVLGKRQE